MVCVCSVKGIRKREPGEQQDAGTRYIPASSASAGEADKKILARLGQKLSLRGGKVRRWCQWKSFLGSELHQMRTFRVVLLLKQPLNATSVPRNRYMFNRMWTVNCWDVLLDQLILCLCWAVLPAFGRTLTSWLSIYCHLVDDRKLTAYKCF